MIPQLRHRWERGDTIVEVLIAITIMSAVLAGAYVTTNRSLSETRDAQERGNALKLVEGQLEELKSMASGSPAIFTTGSSFCVDTVHGSVVSSGNTACVVDSTGQPTTTQPAYHLSISATNVGSAYTFTISNTWASVTGNGNDHLQMAYRLYQ